MDNLIKGEVSIQAINVDTGEITYYPTELNDISLANLKNMFSCNTSASVSIILPNRRLAGYYNSSNVWKIAISEHDFEQSIMNYNMHTFEKVDVIENYPVWTNKVLITDKDFMTFIADIPQPLADRYIRGVGLVSYAGLGGGNQGYSSGRTVTNLKLTSPCFQATNILLRITYKLYFNDAVAASPKTNVTDGFYKYIKDAFKTVSDGSVTNANYVYFYKSDAKVISNFYNWDSQDTINISTNVNFPLDAANNRKSTDASLMNVTNATVTCYSNGSKISGTHTTLSDTTTMGTFFRTIAIGSTSDSSYYTYERPFVFHKAVPDNTSPLQNVFKMNISGNNYPFLNATYLSAMTGSITVGTGSWITQPYPKIFKIDITNTGSNGTATYKVKSLKFTGGFIQNTFCPREAILPQEGYNTVDNSYLRKASNEQIILENMESGGTTFRTPDDSKFVVATNCIRTKNAIALYNIETGEKRCLDSTTISGFNIANTSDCATAGGFTFVTCATTGLWKINSSFTSATHITVAGVDDTKAYQIDVKANGDLWVMFEGGLCQSTDLGASWTVYNTGSPTVFSITGITNSNWANVTSMIIDPNHVDDRILFVLGTGGGTNNANGFVWWSRATATATKPTNGIPFTIFTLSEGLKRSDLIRCVNGAWFSHANTVSSSPSSILPTLHVFNYNASSLNTTKALGANIYFSPRAYPATIAGIDGMFIGSGRNEYSGGNGLNGAFFINSANVNTLPATITESSPQVEFFCRFGNNDFTSDMRIYKQSSFSSHGSYPVCYLKNSNMMLYGGSIFYGNSLRVAPLIIDPSITNYNTYESACWEHYGWDGSNWVLGNSNSKTCHSSVDALLDGLTISFTNGVSGTSFISTDFFTFIIGNGLMKDNFTSYTYSIPYYNEATKTITNFEPYSALPDNKVLFTPADPDLSGGNAMFSYSYKRGRITSCVIDRIFYSEQRADLSTVFTLKFKPIIAYSAGNGKYIGVANSSTGANILTAKMTGNGTMVIRNSSDSTVATITGITYTTEITMERTIGNTIKVYDASIVSGVGSVGTPYYTSAVINNAMVVVAQVPGTDPYVEMGWYDVTFSSTDTSVYRVICGDSGTGSGIFNSKFTGLTCTSLMGDSKVYVNGVEQTIISTSPLTLPTTGQVRLGAGGTLTFPNAVSGSTITGYVTAHYHP